MKSLIFLLFIAGIVGLGVIIGKGTPSPSGESAGLVSSPNSASLGSATPSPTSTDSTAIIAQGGNAPSGTIFALIQSAGQTEIQSIDIVSKSKKTIYKDEDPGTDIQLVSNVTRSGDSIILLLTKGDELAGSLISLSTDGARQQTVLAEQFASSGTPAISPDKTKLAFTSFSNAEPNFGFALLLASIDGKDKVELIRDESGISQLAFSPDGQAIAFIKGAAASGNEITLVDIKTKKLTPLYSLKDKVIEDFDWSPVGLLTFAAAPSGQRAQNQSEIYLFDPKSRNLASVTKNSAHERSPRVAPDGSGIAYIQAKSDKLIDNNKPGDIIVTYPDGSKPEKLGEASQLLGWVK